MNSASFYSSLPVINTPRLLQTCEDSKPTNDPALARHHRALRLKRCFQRVIAIALTSFLARFHALIERTLLFMVWPITTSQLVCTRLEVLTEHSRPLYRVLSHRRRVTTEPASKSTMYWWYCTSTGRRQLLEWHSVTARRTSSSQEASVVDSNSFDRCWESVKNRLHCRQHAFWASRPSFHMRESRDRCLNAVQIIMTHRMSRRE